ncbi:MAG: FixH family protein [Phycisphaerales bacterium JB043]
MSARIPPSLFWPGLVGVISMLWLGVLLFAWGVAENDPSFAVEENFYEASEQWDATQAERRASDLLGWRSEIFLTPTQTAIKLDVVLRDAGDVPIEDALVEIVAFANAAASDRIKVSCAHGAQGVYTTTLEHPRTGQWEIRVRAARNDDIHVSATRHEMPATLVAR